jgi:hypothetical protein
MLVVILDSDVQLANIFVYQPVINSVAGNSIAVIKELQFINMPL